MDTHPVTETRGVDSADLDLRSTAELVALMNREDAHVPEAVARALDEIAALVDVVADRLARGGRLVYVGAGTSGRLAQIDAEECAATFGTSSSRVVAVMAGSNANSVFEREAAEDDAHMGAVAVEALGLRPEDVVVVVSASGSTPFALGAARAAGRAGVFTAAVVCAEGSELAALCDLEVAVVVGPEVLAGSTRLKAGTAQKLVLNTISTVAMVRLGKTYAGLMVDVVPANEKLRGRVKRIVGEATGAPEDAVDDALERASGDPKVAIVSLLAGVDTRDARERLEANGGRVREAIGL